jgi:hypothetical protein
LAVYGRAEQSWSLRHSIRSGGAWIKSIVLITTTNLGVNHYIGIKFSDSKGAPPPSGVRYSGLKQQITTEPKVKIMVIFVAALLVVVSFLRR